MSAPGFTRVTPTIEEKADWRLKYPRRANPHRVAYDACGHRIWLSGLGIGSHRRACKVVVTLGGDRYDAAEYAAWAAGGTQPEKLVTK